MLKFSDANAKLEELYNVPELEIWLADGRKVYSLDLLSGWSCPSAKDCLSKVIELPTGKKAIKDGPETEFRCFSASQEVMFPGVYKRRKHNYDTLRGLHLNDMIHELNQSMPYNLGICRIHVAGDFFNSDYMFAWINMAIRHSDRLFYAYTKSLKYWLKYIDWIEQLDNFILTASYGGRDDDLIFTHGLRHCNVVGSEAETHLPIDHDDSHAARPSQRHNSFSLLIHGTQPKGSEAAEALKKLKGKGSYSRKRKEKV